MKKILLMLVIMLPTLLTAQEWEYVALKNAWVPKIGFDGDIVYINVWSDNAKGILVSKDNGANFTPKGGALYVADFLEFNNKMLVAENWLLITRDTGETWQSYTLYGTLSTPRINALAKIDSFVFAGHGRIQRETNPETSCFPNNNWPDIVDTSFYGWNQQMIVWNDTLFSAQNNKRIIFSPNKGETWDSCYTRVNNDESSTLNCFTINENYIFAGLYFDGIYRTSNLGSTWESVGKGMMNDTVNCLLSDGPNIIAGTQNGVFFSTDNGESWYPRNYGLDSLIIFSIKFHNDEIWMGCIDGLYKIKKEKMFTSVKQTTGIEALSLSPNPATDYIEITIPPLESVLGCVAPVVRVFDVLGIEVMTASIHPMTQSHRMNIENLPPGVYIVQIGNLVSRFVKM